MTLVTLGSAADLCPNCRARSPQRETAPGRVIPYRNLSQLPIPDEVPLSRCLRCRTWSMDPRTQTELLPLLHQEYRRVLRSRVRAALDALTQHTPQNKTERLLGLSQGYLSRLRSGASTPSPELLSLLVLLAQDPEATLEKLRTYWTEPKPELPPETVPASEPASPR